MGVSPEAPIQVGILIGITLLATQVFRETKESVFTFFNVSSGQELINITYYNTKTSISAASSFITGIADPVGSGVKRTADYLTYTLGASALLVGGGVLYSATSSKRKKNKLDEYGPPTLLLVGGTALILAKNVI